MLIDFEQGFAIKSRHIHWSFQVALATTLKEVRNVWALRELYLLTWLKCSIRAGLINYRCISDMLTSDETECTID